MNTNYFQNVQYADIIYVTDRKAIERLRSDTNMSEKEQTEYCLNTLLRVPGHTCNDCNISRGSIKCNLICKKVENMIS